MIRNPTRVLIPLFLAVFVVAGFAAVTQAQAPKEPETVVLKGSPMGGVKFNHKTHAHNQAIKCETCHHASKPEKPMKAAQQKCQDCHTKVASAPMKTTTAMAFHGGPMAKNGLCADCHQKPETKALAKGPLPSKCPDCHKKENV